MVDPLDKVAVVLPRGQQLADLLAARPQVPFSAAVTGFIEDLGRSLRADPESRRFPELVALGFWARRATIQRLKAGFDAAYPAAVRMPRGMAFHVAPSNVDTIFVYSLLLSMLAGNTNIVRISSRAGEQSGHLLTVLDRALAAADPAIGSAIAVVRYDHDKAVTDALSARAALRIVWGGDATVGLVRGSPLAPAGTELVFPNKYSLAVFDAAAWNADPDQAGVARSFVNDALWFGQMACSSPRALVWRGSPEAVATASASFWAAVDTAAATADLAFEDAHAVAKLLGEQGLAIGGGAHVLATTSNRVRVVRADTLAGLGDPAAAGNGFFREYRIENLAALMPLVQRNWQTLVSHGIPTEEWRSALQSGLPHGIDRIVRVGQALDFDAVWDGVDLLAAMTRMTAISV
ncbi:MAG: acyl-CoA reductase [Polymorphobacter sp.]